MAQSVLVVGGTGAGKTTYARRLALELGAVRFSIDDWMTTLFWMDSPQPVEFEWTMARIARCEAMILDLCGQLADVDRPAILDLGFTTRTHRDDIRSRLGRKGISSAIHFIDIPADLRWKRVQVRNADKGETYAMRVDREMFDFMERMWEPPLPAEWQADGGLRVVE